MRRALAGVLGLAALAVAAEAAVPPAARIRAAAAERDRAAGRAQALSLQVELRFEGREEAAATGTLLTGPAGASRLELLSESGFIERQLLRGGQRGASRDGEPVPDARPFLPPLYLLQAPSGEGLAGWLLELGVRAEEVGLGHEGPRDCYVLGGVAPGVPAAWIDMETLDVVRIDLAGGIRYRLGPIRSFEGLLLPEWIEVTAPGDPPARLAVTGASRATAGPDAFAAGWLGRR